jgi:UDP-N-acetylglucosamine 3-dehydrogenase
MAANVTGRTVPAKKKVILVGVGRMGKNHLRVLRETPGFEVVGIVESHGAPPPDLGSIPFFRSLDEITSIDFDAAVVSTPTATHHEIAMRLVSMGKHLLVEKPIASTSAQSAEVIRAAQDKNLVLAVGHVERFNPAVRKLREIIREGWLGTPIHFSFTRVGGYPETIITGNNVLLDLAVHDIDVLRSLVGPVKLEHSMCHVTWREGVFDTAEILLGATSGASATVHVNWVTPTKIRTIRVTGTRGVCFVDYILQTCELFGGSLLKQMEPTSASFDVLREVYGATDRIQFGVQKVEPLRAELEQFHAMLTTGEAGELCTGRDAYAAVLLAERAVQVESVRTRTPAAVTGALPTPDDEWV